MEIKELLERIGLTELESKAYLFLLQEVPITAGVLAKNLNIQRSTAYYVLKNLQKKGFVLFSLKGKRKLFRAANPEVLKEYASETYEQAQKLIPDLLSKKSQEENDEALLFTGYKGLFAAYNQMLTESKSGQEFLILGARGGEDVSVATYRNFYKNFNKKRIQKNISERILMNKELKEKIGKYYEKLSKTKVRYLPQHTLVPIVIYPKGIAIVQWKKEPSLFLLRGKTVQESFIQYFDILWKTAKP